MMQAMMRIICLVTMISHFMTGRLIAECGNFDNKKSESSKLEYLNGEKYHANVPVVLGGVPVVTGVDKMSSAPTVSGCISLHSKVKNNNRPLKFTDVYLNREDHQVAKTMTDEFGHFTFFEELPSGDYQVVTDSKKYGHSIMPIKLPIKDKKDLEIQVENKE